MWNKIAYSNTLSRNYDGKAKKKYSRMGILLFFVVFEHTNSSHNACKAFKSLSKTFSAICNLFSFKIPITSLRGLTVAFKGRLYP